MIYKLKDSSEAVSLGIKTLVSGNTSKSFIENLTANDSLHSSWRISVDNQARLGNAKKKNHIFKREEENFKYSFWQYKKKKEY